MAKRYYAVLVGHRTGIFTSWYGKGGAFEATQGCPGAMYRGFNFLHEAQAWLKTTKPVKPKHRLTRKQRKSRWHSRKSDFLPARTRPNHNYPLYSGNCPPWDDSLGEFSYV